MNTQSDEPTMMNRRRVRILIAAIAIVLGIVLLWRPLTAWFAPEGRRTAARAQHAEIRLSDETVEELKSALGAYEQIRLLLVNDTIEGLAAHAAHLAASLRAARELGPPAGSPLAIHIELATASADALGLSETIEVARRHYQDVNEHLIPVVGSISRVREGWHVFSCPMVEGFNQWMQPSEGIENPYMGQSMLTCGSSEIWPEPAPATAGAADGAVHVHGDEEIAYWTCPMHPSVRQSGPGGCPICGMDLLPVSRRDVETGVLMVDQAARRRIGLRTAVAEERAVDLVVRAVGKTTFDESRLRDVTLKLKGWVERLYVNETGQAVRRGQPLLAIYSPELYAAQQEYLLALRSQAAAQHTGAPGRADYLVRATRERLRLWDLSDAQIRQIEQNGEPIQRMPILSPVSGFVIEKNVFEGSAVEPGQRLYRVAALDSVWVEADVYERDLQHVRVGQNAVITLPNVPGRRLEGKLTFVFPYLDPQTRTGKVRIQLPNPDLELRPEMYANVEIRIDRGVRLVIPDSAVIQTGPRSLVFLDIGEGRLKPQEVQLGARTNGAYEVLSGVEPGDVVVTSANFLISSESRLRSAAQWEGDAHERH
jgi:membrane fusion protein, copper/silver efflux system